MQLCMYTMYVDASQKDFKWYVCRHNQITLWILIQIIQIT